MRKAGEKKRAVGYTRVSTDEQAREGVSLENQENKIRAYAESQEWELVKIYREEGYSGKVINRPELNKMLSDIKEGDIDTVLVYKVDRLTRKQKDLWHLLEDVFDPAGVGFKSVIEPFDTTTAQGKAFLGMLGVFAQLERDTIAERTKDSLALKTEKGEYLGTPPLGYRAIDKDLKAVDSEIAVVRCVKKLRGNGRKKVSLRCIADTLNREGYQAKRGGQFYASTIAYILTNQRYATVN